MAPTDVALIVYKVGLLACWYLAEEEPSLSVETIKVPTLVEFWNEVVSYKMRGRVFELLSKEGFPLRYTTELARTKLLLVNAEIVKLS